ncbi:MAG: NAD-dependent epimerase/dehydratase family protein [Betaproteobacteria bacterium]|nr:NAD-dependent epimerase/dehydratase family protein [Betaproteobacteria bacterium]
MRRLLIVGCGDVGLRLLGLVAKRYRVYALSRSDARDRQLRLHGAIPVRGDLDDASTLTRLSGIAEDVVHLAPPPASGARDMRTSHLICSLASASSLPQRLIYMSTTGVYGDCRDAWVDETRRTHPQTDRAKRRCDAERQLRAWTGVSGIRLSILRVPGIYAADRLPLERLRSGTPVLTADADPYTNHVHADDLARAVVAALARGRSGRVYNAVDFTEMRMGEYFDMVAQAFGLQVPPRVTLPEARRRLPPMLLSFMTESRRLHNRRLVEELRFGFRYPTARDGVLAALSQY